MSQVKKAVILAFSNDDKLIAAGEVKVCQIENS